MDSVFVNSLPKSGTHLLSKLLGIAGGKEVYHFGSGKVLDSRWVARARRVLMYPSIFEKGVIVGVDSPVEISRKFVTKKISTLSPGEFVTGHVGYSEDILNICSSFGVKKICVVRDPRSIVVSFIHYVQGLERHYLNDLFKDLGFDAAVSMCLTGFSSEGKSLESLVSRYRALEPWLREADVLTLRFEDLVGSMGNGSDSDQKEAIEKIFNHLGVGSEVDVDVVARDLFGPGKATFRKGTVDSWREELSKDSCSAIEGELSEFFVRFGYE